MNDIAIRVEAVAQHGMATIWDAEVLIWAAGQIVEARDAGLRTSRLMVATPYEIPTFIGRDTSGRDYHRLKAALDRLQSTTVATTLRQTNERRMHRFSWINEWNGPSAPTRTAMPTASTSSCRTGSIASRSTMRSC
jgi:plasmid replication initiation protein